MFVYCCPVLMCQLYCPGRGHSVRWFELSVKALPQRAMNMCLTPVVSQVIPRNWGCCSNPACCTKVSMTQNRSKNTTQKKKLFKNKHKGTSSAASNSCSCLNLSLVKGAGIWGGKSGFESEILSAAPPKSFEIYGEKDFLITPPPTP